MRVDRPWMRTDPRRLLRYSPMPSMPSAFSLGAEFSDGVVGPAELVKAGGVPPPPEPLCFRVRHAHHATDATLGRGWCDLI